MEAIMNMLTKLKEVELRVFIANVCVNCGIDKVTVRKYLGALETANYIEIKDGLIKWSV